MATIAAIRNSTHHVLGKITGDLDGPYLHHRALLENVDDAEEYAVDVVLSELKNAVDKQDVGNTFAGPVAVAARIRELSQGNGELVFKWADAAGEKTYNVAVDKVIELVNLAGLGALLAGLPSAGKPAKKLFVKGLSSLFADNCAVAKEHINRFAVLTSVRSHPGNHLYVDGDNVPSLNLGTVIQHPDHTYLLCLQASCNSVRLEQATAFFFIPVAPSFDDKSSYVVPSPGDAQYVRASRVKNLLRFSALDQIRSVGRYSNRCWRACWKE